MQISEDIGSVLSANQHMYRPDDHMKGFAVTTSHSSGGCTNVFKRAFINTENDDYTAEHSESAYTPLGYKHASHTQWQSLNVSQVDDGNGMLIDKKRSDGTLVYGDDIYEVLGKALAGYNGGQNSSELRERTWPHLLATKSGSLPARYEYALEIRKDAGISYRDYIWQGGVYNEDVNGDGQIENVVEDLNVDPPVVGVQEVDIPWCFEFGEKEWAEGQSWVKIKDAAQDKDPDGNPQTPVGRITCP